jgi:hypothetical protein
VTDDPLNQPGDTPNLVTYMFDEHDRLRAVISNRPAKCSLAELRSHSLGGCSSHAAGRSGAGLASGT